MGCRRLKRTRKPPGLPSVCADDRSCYSVVPFPTKNDRIDYSCEPSDAAYFSQYHTFRIRLSMAASAAHMSTAVVRE